VFNIAALVLLELALEHKTRQEIARVAERALKTILGSWFMSKKVLFFNYSNNMIKTTLTEHTGFEMIGSYSRQPILSDIRIVDVVDFSGDFVS